MRPIITLLLLAAMTNVAAQETRHARTEVADDRRHARRRGLAQPPA
ncbi:hypothetical protein LF41_2907 [Lysobacter dokdonensis DS-58]|uniref:Uncharacterized protein n=1 Tax=Lysobacter dokdonensis DS-58 TaxID=1300345 RepID=A0A0A2WGF3_9GAMM|nr:hypothetical protein LF41_2907 [Lysobacter dokdonensis DS-58]